MKSYKIMKSGSPVIYITNTKYLSGIYKKKDGQLAMGNKVVWIDASGKT